jgi:hypothetical protein
VTLLEETVLGVTACLFFKKENMYLYLQDAFEGLDKQFNDF